MEQEKIIDKYRLKDLESLLCDVENAVCAVIEEKNIIEQEDYINVLLYTVGKSIVTLREIITLCQNGYPDGALSLARNIFEQFIHVAFIESRRKKDDFNLLIEKYYDSHKTQCANALRFSAEKIECSKEKAKEVELEIEQIPNKYNVKIYGDYWWSGVNSFSKMCDDVCKQYDEMENFIRLLQCIYKRACLAIHSSCMGNRVRIGSLFYGIDFGTRDSGQETALYLATASLIYIVGCVYRTLEINSEEIVRSLNDLAIYYKELEKR